MVSFLEKKKIKLQLEECRDGLTRNGISFPDEIEVTDSDYHGTLTLVKRMEHPYTPPPPPPPENSGKDTAPNDSPPSENSNSDVALKVLRQHWHIRGMEPGAYHRAQRNFQIECQIHQGLESVMDSILLGNSEFKDFVDEGLVGSVIVPVIKSNWADDTPPYFIMTPWMKCDFSDVLDEISENPTYSFSRRLEFIMKILASYTVLHNITGEGDGVIHADIKPDNILVDENDMLHITDFNVASWADKGLCHENPNGESHGTLPYMAHELLDGRRPAQAKDHYNVQTEIYALGIMIHEILTGKKPFGIIDSDSDHTIISRVNSGTFDSITKIHGADNDAVLRLNSICRRSIKRYPDQRQQSVRELLREVKDVYDTVMARQTTPSL